MRQREGGFVLTRTSFPRLSDVRRIKHTRGVCEIKNKNTSARGINGGWTLPPVKPAQYQGQRRHVGALTVSSNLLLLWLPPHTKLLYLYVSPILPFLLFSQSRRHHHALVTQGVRCFGNKSVKTVMGNLDNVDLHLNCL